jgi:tight adherence protein B
MVGSGAGQGAGLLAGQLLAGRVWGRALLATAGLADPVARATGCGALLCLLGWTAWWLSGREAAQRRREGLFPKDTGGLGELRGARELRAGRGGSSAGRGGPSAGRGGPGGTSAGSAGRGGPWAGLRGRRPWLVGTRPPPELLLLPLGLLAAWPTHSPLVAAVAAGAVVPAIRLRGRRGKTKLRERRRTAVVALCAALAGELRTGATPHQAVEMAAGEFTAATAAPAARRQPTDRATVPVPVLDCTVLLAAVRYGGAVPEAFRALAELPGAEGAAGIAACWQVASSSGAGLAEGLDRVAEGLRAEHALRESVRAELAGPRSTAGLLALLPVFGLLLGAALGADPLRMLLHTPSGLLCLLFGAGLEWAGMAWTARIARGAEAVA